MKILKAICLMAIISLFVVQTSYAEDNEIEWSPKTSIDKYHNFTIKFSEEIDFTTVNPNTITITKSKGSKVDISFEMYFAREKCRELQRKIQSVATQYFPYFLDNAFVKRKLWPVYEIMWAW